MNALTQLNGLLPTSGGSLADLNGYALLQAGFADELITFGVIAVIVILVGTAAYWITRYKKCPSNKILVVYGKVAGGKSAKTLHGGGAFIIPIIQSYQFMSLEPMRLKLDLNGGSLMTIAGRSRLRLLNVDGRRGFQLAYGNLWATVAQSAGAWPVSIQTPTATVEATVAQFDVEAHSMTSIVRVNSGTANVVRLADGQAVDVVADHQAVVSARRSRPFAVARQPEPVNAWNCSMLAGQGAVFGKILPPTTEGRSRLGAIPLLIGKKTTIFVANFSVQCSSSPPVLIESGSRVRIRGTTRTEGPVYFGITTQRIKGVFFGKYTAKVGAGALGQAGEPWQIEVPLSKFKPKKQGDGT